MSGKNKTKQKEAFYVWPYRLDALILDMITLLSLNGSEFLRPSRASCSAYLLVSERVSIYNMC